MFTTLATSYPGGPAVPKTTAAMPHNDAVVLPLRIVTTTPICTPAEELRPDTGHRVAGVEQGFLPCPRWRDNLGPVSARQSFRFPLVAPLAHFVGRGPRLSGLVSSGLPDHKRGDGDRQRDHHGSGERDGTDKHPIDDPRRKAKRYLQDLWMGSF